MSLVPRKPIEKVGFFEGKQDGWNTHATALGTSTTIIADLITKTANARAAYIAQQAALDAAKNATATFHDAVDIMATAGAGVIKQIRGKAELVGGNSVYLLASIPAPATPTPIGPLGTPSDFKVTLAITGEPTLTFKCANPVGATGTTYQVWRRIGDAGEMVYLGGTGQKEFTDETLPAGSTFVTYQIQATRSTGVGPFAQFNVNFGTGSGGTVTVSPVAAPERQAA